jgi:nitrile hydratase
MSTHHRTPAYVKGRVGIVRALSGSFYDPEIRAYGASGLPKRNLYLIEFGMEELWGKRYDGPGGDHVVVDLFEHWLEPVGGCAGPGAM